MRCFTVRRSVAAQHVRVGSRARHSRPVFGGTLLLGPSEDLEQSATLDSEHSREFPGERRLSGTIREVSVPVILTIYAVINCGILVFTYLDNTVDTDSADLNKLPLFSAFLEKRERHDVHEFRHVRMCLIAGPHIWVKTSLLAMSWRSSSRFEKANIMVPLFLTMGSKVYSQVQAYKDYWCNRFQTGFRNGTKGDRVCLLVFFLFWNTPALFVTACVVKLVGIFACPTTHLLNLTSGCVE